MRTLSYLILKLFGWKYKSDLPENLRSFVMIAAPHTSNFDFFTGVSVALKLKRNAKFVIKDSWLTFPMNLLLGPMGAIGVNREKLQMTHGHSTDLMAELFKKYPEFVLLISPEGTRKPNENWKTGFYYIAQKANVPIVIGYADWKTKTIGTGPIIYPKDFDQDMRTISDFYSGVTGHTPKNFKLDTRFAHKS